MDAIEKAIVLTTIVAISLLVYVGVQTGREKEAFSKVCVENNGIPMSNGNGLQCIQKLPARVVED